jgi:hypothetical protein
MSNTATAFVPSNTPNPRREELKVLSNELKQFATEAETTINAVLVAHYSDFTGEKSETFKTLAAWNAEGYLVKRGAESFIIWGAPEKKTLNKADGLHGKEAEVITFCRMVHLFHVGQVFKKRETPNKETAAVTPERKAATPVEIEIQKKRKVSKKTA